MIGLASAAEVGARLFGAEDFRFQFGMRRGGGHWFEAPRGDERALADRRRWLAQAPRECLAWSPEADAVWPAVAACFAGGDLPPAVRDGGLAGCRALGESWEPDFLVMRRGGDGEIRLAGGCVCFPSSWELAGKVGRGVADIHGVVPTLNASLGDRIHTFLGRLSGEAVFERENWGLAAVGERNHHPARLWPRLDGGARVATTFLRVEHQAFRALPGGHGLLFVIRLAVYPLAEVLATPGVRENLCRQLLSMPEEVAAYKGLARARPALVAELAS